MLVRIIDDHRHASNTNHFAISQNDAIPLKLYYGDQEIFSDELNCLYQYLSPAEISRSKRFIKKSDERTYVITHALVNKNISELLGNEFNKLKINYFDQKKPYVEQSNLDFNLSHSSNYFAFAISNYENVFIGVDIEKVNIKLDFEPIVNRYFHEHEIEYVLNNNLNNLIPLRRFYEIWTRKEAFFKMLGIGLTEELSQIDLSPGEREIIIHDKKSFDESNFSETHIYTFSFFEDRVLSLSTNRPVSIIPEHYESFF